MYINDLDKYEKKYKQLLINNVEDSKKNNLSIYINKPYIYLNKLLRKLSKKHNNILELASGSGIYSKQFSYLFKKVTLSDLSKNSLLILSKKFENHKNVEIIKLDIENINLASNSQELICMIGSISYGDNLKVISEINRILKKNGSFLILDSPNENFIFSLYRIFLLIFRKDRRSKKTFRNLLTEKTITILNDFFEIKEIRYFGHFLPIAYIISFLPKKISQRLLEKLITFEDKLKYNNNGYKVVIELKK